MGDVKEMKGKKPENRMEEYIESVKILQEQRQKNGILVNPQMEGNTLLHELNLSAALIVDELAVLINLMNRMCAAKKDTEN